MSVDFSFRPTININFGTQNIINTGGADAAGALDLVNSFFNQPTSFSSGDWSRPTPFPGSIPGPSIGQAGAPAGQGLQVNDDGSVTTAGGFRVHATGERSEWKIYGPDGEQLTRVWGDPHVEEADGTKWDFTKDSDFVLPDGTRIHADTNYDGTSGTSQSVTTGLHIMNGTQRYNIEGVNTGRPQGTMHEDAYEWRATHLATNPNIDEFHLGSGEEEVQWARVRNGQYDGVIQDHGGRPVKVDAGNHRIYDQTTDRGQLHTDIHMRPPVGSRAWGNLVRAQTNDYQARVLGQTFGPLGAWPALQNSFGIHANHIEGQFNADLMDLYYGGLPSYFNNYFAPFDALSGMIDLLRSDSDWRRQLQHGGPQQIWT